MQEGVAVTPNEETKQEAQTEATTAPAPEQSEGIFGETEDGTHYDAISPAVFAYRQLFPDVSLEAAIGSVVGLHHSFVKGKAISGDVPGIERVVELIREGIASEAEEIDDVDEQENDPEDQDLPEDDEVDEEEPKADPEA